MKLILVRIYYAILCLSSNLYQKTILLMGNQTLPLAWTSGEVFVCVQWGSPFAESLEPEEIQCQNTVIQFTTSMTNWVSVPLVIDHGVPKVFESQRDEKLYTTVFLKLYFFPISTCLIDTVVDFLTLTACSRQWAKFTFIEKSVPLLFWSGASTKVEVSNGETKLYLYHDKKVLVFCYKARHFADSTCL